MRVAMLGPVPGHMGGVSSVARELLDAPELADVDVRYFHTVGDDSKLRNTVRGQGRWLKALADGWRPDLVHVHMAAPPVSFYRKMVLTTFTGLFGCPLVLHLHSSQPMEDRWDSRTHRFLSRRMLRRPDLVLTVSGIMKRTLAELLPDVSPVEVLYNPVDLAAHAGITPAPGAPPAVLFLGRMGEAKGVYDLVDVIPDVLKVVPDARFLFGGNGEVDQVKQAAVALGVGDHVEMLGWIRSEEKRAAIARSTLLCLPSYHEGLPLVVLEAAAAHLPVVSTNINGVPEAVLHGDTGLLYAPGDKAALRDHLIALLSDLPRARAMGAAGYAHVSRTFARTVVAGQLRQTWERVLSAG